MAKIYFGKQTECALDNFGRGLLPRELIRAYGEVKKACLCAIQEYEQRFTGEIYDAILRALDAVIAGMYDDQFPLPLDQGGAGTSINFNFNEVIAALAAEMYELQHNSPVHLDPVEDINRFQSTNDTFPTAVTILLLRKLDELEKSVISLQELLIKKETEYAGLLLTGRTEMQDALPITLGQVFASWAGSIERDRWRCNKLKERIRTIALGGTAIGTCYTAPREYVFLAEKHLRKITGLALSRSQNLTDEIASLDKYSELANGVCLTADNLFKISGDLLLYTSGFIGEIRHPALQYGSTIMAAKINPVILEYVRGLAVDIRYECAKITDYARQGQLQLNPYLPFIVKSFLRAFHSLELAAGSFIHKFLELMQIDEARMLHNLLNSKALINALASIAGYHKIKILEKALEQVKPGSIEKLKELINQVAGIERTTLDAFFDPVHLTSCSKGK